MCRDSNADDGVPFDVTASLPKLQCKETANDKVDQDLACLMSSYDCAEDFMEALDLSPSD